MQGLGDLVRDEADVGLFQQALADYREEVALHVREDQVDVAVVVGFYYVFELHEVWVGLQFLEDADLAVGALCVFYVTESIEYFFQGEDLLGFFANHLPDVSV